MENTYQQNITKILNEMSEEITFTYEVATDTMVFSDKYKSLYGRKNKISHFLRDSKRGYSLSANSVVQLEALKQVADYGDSNRYIQVQWPNKQGKFEWCEVVFRHVTGED